MEELIGILKQEELLMVGKIKDLSRVGVLFRDINMMIQQKITNIVLAKMVILIQLLMECNDFGISKRDMSGRVVPLNH